MDLLTEARSRIVFPYDTSDRAQLLRWAERFGRYVGVGKIGLEAGCSMGWDAAFSAVRPYGLEDRPAAIFADLKLHDIPNTMAKAAAAIVRHPQVAYINVHASAGPTGIRAVAAVKGRAKLLAVTVLTSLDDEECTRIYGSNTQDTVNRLAELVADCGIDGIICAPTDVEALRVAYPHMRLMTPGVRPSWAAANDQKRVMTPGDAIRAGADDLVIGRPISDPPAGIGSSAAAARLIADEIAAALAERPT